MSNLSAAFGLDMFAQRSRRVTYAATFGALAGLLGLLPAIPGVSALLGFYPLTYLLIDPAEIFDFLAFFVAGPVVAIPTAFIHFLILLLAAAYTGNNLNLLGSFMKLAAVLASFLGMSLGLKIHDRLMQKTKLSRLIGASFLTGTVVRVLIMLPANVIFIFVAGTLLFGSVDSFLNFPASLLRGAGIQTGGFWDLMGWILLITSIYNVFQIALASVPSYLLFVSVLRSNLWGGQAKSGIWIATHFRLDVSSPHTKAKT